MTERVGTVVHTAGPFVKTAEPMLEACVNNGTNYMDITGEVPVFEKHFEFYDRAKTSNCFVVGGMGFDVVPTDCLAKYVASRVKDPTSLEIVIQTGISPSSGTLKTMLELAPGGGYRRRNDNLEPASVAEETGSFRFPEGFRTAVSLPLGDLVTAWHSTGTPNITTYLAVPPGVAALFGTLAPFVQGVTRIDFLRRALQWGVGRIASGPSEEDRREEENWIYARASNKVGESYEAWLRTPEAYEFTVLSCLEAIDRIETVNSPGTLTPSGAFGEDFVLELDGTERYDNLP
ncbi:MAG: trans-acting enoyl reductase family protein [bacterium]